ncbi:MAG TPA: ATP-binding protein [Terriglobia bacterium]|nr:ATP-binding protein [Terriglobia bacterium]
MAESYRRTFGWMDVLWLIFLAGLAVLPPLFEIHKQLILAGIGLFQIFEGRILKPVAPSRRSAYSVLVKTLLASLLLVHTGGINSNYYPIYYVPIVSAAMLYDALGTVLWTLACSAAYCSFLIWALEFYQLTVAGATELATRILFFFLVALVVNRFVTENRRQTARYQHLAETLAETNRQLEKAQADARRSERLAALGQLSAGLAHEIRNPLGVIRGSAEMLHQRLEHTDALTAELAGYISSEVERLNNLVGRFLDFARPLQLKLETQDIIPVIERALKSVQEMHPESQVTVEKQYGENLPQAPLDAELCERIFINLFSNAYEVMPEGGKLRVSVKPSASNGQPGVAIEVEDTGPGVPQEQREHIFNPFFTSKQNGVGLGLSIVSKIVDDHHGRIELASEPGTGACFRLYFPAES